MGDHLSFLLHCRMVGIFDSRQRKNRRIKAYLKNAKKVNAVLIVKELY